MNRKQVYNDEITSHENMYHILQHYAPIILMKSQTTALFQNLGRLPQKRNTDSYKRSKLLMCKTKLFHVCFLRAQYWKHIMKHKRFIPCFMTFCPNYLFQTLKTPWTLTPQTCGK